MWIFLDNYSAAITAIATFLLCIVTGGLVWLGWRQILTTRRQLRAYVHVASAAVRNSIDHKNAAVIIQFKNFGQTPAHKVRVWVGTHVQEFPLKNSLPYQPADLPVAADVLAPTRESTIEIPFSPLNAWESAQINAGKGAFWAWGEITYKDIFYKAHATKFRFFCGGDNLPRGTMSPDLEGNEAS